MLIYNVSFINTEGKPDETQLDIEEQNTTTREVVEMINLILSLKDELGIQKITDIDFIECKEGDEEWV